jgi:hypothetical protein
VAAVALATVAALSRAMHGTRGGDPGGG